jgi:hypothetical protein
MPRRGAEVGQLIPVGTPTMGTPANSSPRLAGEGFSPTGFHSPCGTPTLAGLSSGAGLDADNRRGVRGLVDGDCLDDVHADHQVGGVEEASSWDLNVDPLEYQD